MIIEVYLSLGSNIGDKKAYLEEAIIEIGKIAKTELRAVSSFYITKPWGRLEQADFINLVIKIMTSLSAERLLENLQNIEMKMGRQDNGRWGPRIIDIDILLYGDKLIHTEELVVPHPHMKQRLFVLVPLRELNPDLVFPDDGTHIQEVLSKVLDREGEDNIIERL